MAEIQTIAVIGAGAVGRGIAFAAALGGYRTILEDILPSSLRTAAAELQSIWPAPPILGQSANRKRWLLSTAWNMLQRWNTPRVKPIW